MGHGHVQLLEEAAGVPQVEEEKVELGDLGEVGAELGALPGGGRPVHIVVGVRVLRHVRRKAQVGEVLLPLFGGGILQHAVKDGVVVGLVVHPAGQGEIDRAQNGDAEHAADDEPPPPPPAGAEEEHRPQAQNAQNGHGDVDELAPAVHHAGEKEEGGVHHEPPPAREAPQGEDRHGQQAQHLHALAVEGVKVGDVPLVAEDRHHQQLDEQVHPGPLQPEGAEEEEEQAGIAQEIDEAQHLDMVGIQRAARQQVERQVPRQGGPDEDQVNGGIGPGVLQGEEEAAELAHRGGSSKTMRKVSS